MKKRSGFTLKSAVFYGVMVLSLVYIVSDFLGKKSVQSISPWFFLWAVAGSVVAVVLVRLWGRRRGDQQYAHAPAGVIPADWQTHPVVVAKERQVPLRWAPPDAISAVDAAWLYRSFGSWASVAALWLGLATRGYMKAVRYSAREVGFQMMPHDPSTLTPSEHALMSALFAGAPVAQARAITVSQFDSVVRGTRDRPDAPCVYRPDDDVGGLLGVAMIIGTLLCLPVLYAMVGLTGTLVAAPLVVGVFSLGLEKGRDHARNAYGYALYEQLRGFRLYIETLPGGQVRWELGLDTFSRNLPYAVAVGGGEQWTALCMQYACQHTVPKPSWVESNHASEWATVDDYGTALLAVRDIVEHTEQLAEKLAHMDNG